MRNDHVRLGPTRLWHSLRAITTHGALFALAAAASVVVFALPPLVTAAASRPPLPATGYQCVSAAGALSSVSACQKSLAQAEARWPQARLALDGSTEGDGSWIVPSPDGLHFDLIAIRSGLGTPPTTHMAARNSISQAYRPVQDVLAASIIQSSSGHYNTSGYSCGGHYTFWWSATYTTFFLANLEMSTQGYWNFCYSATITSLTPAVTAPQRGRS